MPVPASFKVRLVIITLCVICLAYRGTVWTRSAARIRIETVGYGGCSSQGYQYLNYKESKRRDAHGNEFRYRAKVRAARGAEVNR